MEYENGEKEPRISIIIPTHNRPSLCIKAVISVIHQESNNWEVVVVDDGSSEENTSTLELAISNLKNNSISLVKTHKSGGASRARNKGAMLAKFSIITFLDDDDTLQPSYTKEISRLFSNHAASMPLDFAWTAINTRTLNNTRNIELSRECLIEKGQGGEKCFEALGYIRTSGLAVAKRSFLLVDGFDEELHVSEDRDIIFKLASLPGTCASTATPLVDIFIHTGPRLSTSKNTMRQALCDQKLINRHKALLRKHPLLASRFLNVAAKRIYEAGLKYDAIKAVKLLISIRPYDARAIRRYITWSLSKERQLS